MSVIRILILLLVMASTSPGRAEVPPADASAWHFAVAIGYGSRGNPLINSDDIPIVFDLDIGWFGKRFFFDNTDVGYTFYDGNRVTLSAVARVNSERLFFSRADLDFVVIAGPDEVGGLSVAIEPPDRDYAIETGIELLSDGHWGRAELSAFHDVSGTHNGFEINGHIARGFRQQRWYVEPALSVSYKNSQINDYYWGVVPQESNSLLPVYRAGDGFNTTARLAASYQLTRHFAVVGSAQVELLSNEISDSPIVKNNTVSSVYAGLRYTF